MPGMTEVYATIRIEGFHCWRDAPGEVAFLRNHHRHLFVIKVYKPVHHDDRDVEFILLGRIVRQYLLDAWGDMSGNVSSLPPLKIKARSTAFSNSRTFPGQ